MYPSDYEEVTVGATVVMLDAGEIMPPLVEVRRAVRYRVHAVRDHDGVRLAFRSIAVEFLFQKIIDGGIDGIGRRRRLLHAVPKVQPKALGTLHEKIYLGAGDLGHVAQF